MYVGALGGSSVINFKVRSEFLDFEPHRVNVFYERDLCEWPVLGFEKRKRAARLEFNQEYKKMSA